ncbi:unnamed protein product [Linum tenue]|uniref:Uncharacterized protein n=1 Tax=Linum tenue TaxID=586396 RepID=A0AAV0IJP9_9ROSI|nr:unnamed protein product [Linum tenue]
MCGNRMLLSPNMECGGKQTNPIFFWKAPLEETIIEITKDEDLMEMASTTNQPPRIIELYAMANQEVEDVLESDA